MAPKMNKRKLFLELVTCPVCNDLLREATTISECLHTFCRECIHKKLSVEKLACCPVCNVDIGCKPLEKLRPDYTLQGLREMVPQHEVNVPRYAPIVAESVLAEASRVLGCDGETSRDAATVIGESSNVGEVASREDPTPRPGVAFRQHEIVEVMSRENGFVGSYYPARIISELAEGRYDVEYTTLLNDDESGFSRETVEAEQLRPAPIEVEENGFSIGDYVDAYDREGWWVGRVVGKVRSKYTVHFDTTGDRVNYRVEKLRTHLEWAESSENGGWYWWHVHKSSA